MFEIILKSSVHVCSHLPTAKTSSLVNDFILSRGCSLGYPSFFQSVDNALASTRQKMSPRPAYTNSAFYGSGHLGDSFSSPPLGHSSFIETPRQMIH